MSDERLPPAAVSGREIMARAERTWGERLCCRKCYEARHSTEPAKLITCPMFLCPTCGCKRCPKATDHELACTDSNAPGQPGSWYE